MRPLLRFSCLRLSAGTRSLNYLPYKSEALPVTETRLKTPSIKVFLQLDTASSDAIKHAQKTFGRVRQHEGPYRMNILNIPVEERLRCERILDNTALSKRPFEIVLGAPIIAKLGGKRRREVFISAASEASNLQMAIATSIRRRSEHDENQWKDDWIIEPVIWMGISLSEAKAHEILKALNKWHPTNDPKKLRVVGMGMEYPSHDGEILSGYFPFPLWPWTGNKLDFDLSSAFGADTRGLFQQKLDGSTLPPSELLSQKRAHSGTRRSKDLRVNCNS